MLKACGAASIDRTRSRSSRCGFAGRRTMEKSSTAQVGCCITRRGPRATPDRALPAPCVAAGTGAASSELFRSRGEQAAVKTRTPWSEPDATI